MTYKITNQKDMIGSKVIAIFTDNDDSWTYKIATLISFRGLGDEKNVPLIKIEDKELVFAGFMVPYSQDILYLIGTIGVERFRETFLHIRDFQLYLNKPHLLPPE